MVDDYFIDSLQLLSTRMPPSDMIVAQKKYLVVKYVDYQLIVGSLYKLGAHEIL
jgi:hypothetical protein